METTNRCCQCQKFIDVDGGDSGWSATKEDHICLECRDADESSLSILTFITDGKVKQPFCFKNRELT